MNAKLDALLDTLDNMKHPKEMVAVIHCNPYKINPHRIPGANTSFGDAVALVEVNASLSDEEKCEQAFVATNNVGTDYWWSNVSGVRVTLMTNAPVRSTALGDQMLLQNGKKYTCVAGGWTENAD